MNWKILWRFPFHFQNFLSQFWFLILKGSFNLKSWWEWKEAFFSKWNGFLALHLPRGRILGTNEDGNLHFELVIGSLEILSFVRIFDKKDKALIQSPSTRFGVNAFKRWFKLGKEFILSVDLKSVDTKQRRFSCFEGSNPLFLSE